MMRFTDVPMSVMVPPRMEAKLRPIKSFDVAKPGVSREIPNDWNHHGHQRRVVEEGAAQRNRRQNPDLRGTDAPRQPDHRCDRSEIAPVAYIPAATGNSAATVKTPVLLKPIQQRFEGRLVSASWRLSGCP